MVSQSFDELPLTADFSLGLLKNFFVKNKLVRDTLTYQVVLLVAYAVQVFKADQYQTSSLHRAVRENRLQVAIVGAGTMGRLIFEALHNRLIHGSLR